MRAMEKTAMASGAVTGLTLMERAGNAVAGQIRLRWPKPGRVTVLCGPGGNGGDGYVVARLLHQAGWQVRVLGGGARLGSDAAEMRRLWQAIGRVEPLSDDALRATPDGDVYVDAIFGTGLSRPPEGQIAEVLARLGGSGGDGTWFRERLVAVDCPSGLCLDSGAFLGPSRVPQPFPVRAAITVAFDSPKPGHLLEQGPDSCGRLVIADIGLHDWRIRWPAPRRGMRHADLSAVAPEFDIADRRRLAHEPAQLRHWLSKSSGASGHKFSHGHAVILAGGLSHGGAARLAARGALRVGAGLVTICPPQSALIEHLGPPDAVMRRGLNDAATLAHLLEDTRISALCLGPGCGGARAAALLPALLASGRACVLDADALTALAVADDLRLHARCVLTPHAGEFARLFPDLAARLSAPPMRGPAYSRVDAVREAAARCGAVVLLKGPDTVIAEPPSTPAPLGCGQAVIHAAFDIPWLATAGAGDVLSGIITGLLARGLRPLEAARYGAWLHARAARRFGPGLIADDLPEQLPAVFREMMA